MPHRTLVILSVALFALLIVGAFYVPVGLTFGGGRTLEGWWLAMVGIAGIFGTLAWQAGWRRSAILASLYVLCSAAQLSLIRPLWLISIRVPTIDFTDRAHVAAGVLIALQGSVVVALSWKRGAAIARAAVGLFTVPRLLGFAVLFLFSTAHVSLVYPQVFSSAYTFKLYGARVAFAAALCVINLLHLLLIVSAIPDAVLQRGWKRLEAAVSLPGSNRQPTTADRRLPGVVAGFVLVATIVLALGVFQRVPHIPDEAAYLFQAKMIASGMLSSPAPPAADAFQLYLLAVQDGRWYIVTHPGWPALLALGLLVGAPWLINPLLGTLTILIAHALTRRLADYGTAHAVVLLLASSPWFLALSAAYQPHAATLFLAVGGWWLVTEAWRIDRWWPMLVAGLAAGVVFTIRPLDAMILGGLTGLACLLPGRWRPAWGDGLAYGAGCLMTGSLQLAFNYRFTGRLAEFPINAYLDSYWTPGANRLGFGADVGQLWAVLDPIPGHGWRDVLLNTNQNLVNLNFELLGWGVGSLLLVAVHLLWGKWSVIDRLCFGFVGSIAIVYNLYWFSGGPDYGPRYWYLMIFPLVFLTVRGAETSLERLRQVASGVLLRPRLAAAIGVLMFTSVAVFLPWRAVSKYVDYRGQHQEFKRLAAQGAFGADGLVAVETDGEEEFASAFYLNDIVPGSGGPVYVRYRDCGFTQRTAQAFPGRPVYHVTAHLSDGVRDIRVVRLETPISCDDGADESPDQP